MTRALRTGYIEFKPRARLLKLIGAELISNEVLAIIELVKNAHDADASFVSVEFRGLTTGEGTITVRDDGHGMSKKELLGNWMEPAGTTKLTLVGRRTKRGRRVLGEKGVGRFAADKLARTLELTSRCAGEASEMRAVFDWDAFDNDALMLSDVKNFWELRPAKTIATHGTVLHMSGLRAVWTERMFRRLCTRLSRLRSPFNDLDRFAIRVESDEFPEYSGEIRSTILERAPHRVEATFDGNQTIEISSSGAPPVKHTWNGHGDLRCGPVRVRLFGFDLETESISRIGPQVEVRAWLREWSGVSIYRDGFRIWPYGEPHDDWLRLDQRRVNNPVVRLSNNQVVGFVDIGRDRNPDLVDQTNREGLVQSQALDDLRRLMYFIFQILEADRQSVRHPTGIKRVVGAPARGADHADLHACLTRLSRSATPEVSAKLKTISATLRGAMAREEAQQRLVSRGYSELASVGQIAGLISATAVPLLDRMRAELAALAGASKDRENKAVLRELNETAENLAGQLALLSVAGQGPDRRRRSVDLVGILDRFREMIEPVLSARGVLMFADAPSRTVVRAEVRPENLHRILQILTANSLDWLGGVKRPEIRVRATVKGDDCEILFSDNGPGIPGDIASQIFEPFFSGREGGHGMGLTIARNILQESGGRIDALIDGRRKGACIRILLPRKKSRRTMPAG